MCPLWVVSGHGWTTNRLGTVTTLVTSHYVRTSAEWRQVATCGWTVRKRFPDVACRGSLSFGRNCAMDVSPDCSQKERERERDQIAGRRRSMSTCCILNQYSHVARLRERFRW